MRLGRLLTLKKPGQRAPQPDSGAAAAGGGALVSVDRWRLLERLLILGTEGGTCHVSDPNLSLDQCPNLVALAKEDGPRVVEAIQILSGTGRAPKSGPVMFALAAAASLGDTAARQAAFAAVPTVCRTGAQLFEFVEQASAMRGWGRAMRRAVGGWYQIQDLPDLTSQAIRRQDKSGWTHRDLLRLAHPKPESEGQRVLFRWMVDHKEPADLSANPVLEAYLALLKAETPAEAAALIQSSRLPKECVPARFLTERLVWEALMQDMPLASLLRNLGNMTRSGLLAPGTEAARLAAAGICDPDRLKRAKIHPLGLLIARAEYAGGRGAALPSAWTPVPEIVDALDEGFWAATSLLEPAGRRHMVCLDVSGSMQSSFVANAPLSAAEASLALAEALCRTEPESAVYVFNDRLTRLDRGEEPDFESLLAKTRAMPFGATDCAQPMIHAAKHRIPVDVFVVLTDREVWHGDIHPAQALADYRQRMGLPAKLVVAGMCASKVGIADPSDPAMLDVVGFDASVPLALREFASCL